MYTYTLEKISPANSIALKRLADAPQSLKLDGMDLDQVSTKNKLPASFKIEIARGGF